MADAQPDAPRPSTFGKGAGYFFKWAALGTAILFFGGHSAQGLKGLVDPVVFDLGWESLYQPLLTFSVSGGITIGFLVLGWWVASRRKVRWGLGVLILSLLLFVLFVWPTPYKFYRTEDRDVRIRVNRITGAADYVPKPEVPIRSRVDEGGV